MLLDCQNQTQISNHHPAWQVTSGGPGLAGLIILSSDDTSKFQK